MVKPFLARVSAFMRPKTAKNMACAMIFLMQIIKFLHPDAA